MVVGTSLVTQVMGQAWFRSADGDLTPITAGMQIPVSADVVTANGASVQLQVNDQSSLTVGENRDVQVGVDMAQSDLDTSAAAAAVPSDPDMARVLAALNDNADPFADLDATAAVLDGDGGEVSRPSISIVTTGKESVSTTEMTITTEDGVIITITDGDLAISGVEVIDPRNAGRTYGPSEVVEVLDVRNGFADITNIAAGVKGYLLLAGSPDDYNFGGVYVNGLYSGLIDEKNNPWPTGPTLNVSHAKGLIFQDGSTTYLPGSITKVETTITYDDVTLQVDARLGNSPDDDESLSDITLSGFEGIELLSIVDKDGQHLVYTLNGDGTVTIKNVTGENMDGIQVTMKVSADVDSWDITASVDAIKEGGGVVTVDDTVSSSDDIVSSSDALISLVHDMDADGWLDAATTAEAHHESFQQTADNDGTTDLSLIANTDVNLSDVVGDAGSDQDIGATLDAALPVDDTEPAKMESKQDTTQGDLAAMDVDAIADQHQLLQQIVDAGKQGTDVI